MPVWASQAKARSLPSSRRGALNRTGRMLPSAYMEFRALRKPPNVLADTGNVERMRQAEVRHSDSVNGCRRRSAEHSLAVRGRD